MDSCVVNLLLVDLWYSKNFFQLSIYCVRAMAIHENFGTKGYIQWSKKNEDDMLNQNLCGTTLLLFGLGGVEDKNFIPTGIPALAYFPAETSVLAFFF